MKKPLHPWSDIDGGGYPFASCRMGQTWANLHWLGMLIEQQPRLRGCFELGCWQGGFATFLGLHFPGATFTADIRDRRNQHTIELHARLGVRFFLGDCHKVPVLEAILEHLLRPALMFCDGVEKELEFEKLAPLLVPGDVIGVHDVGTEFNPTNPGIEKAVEQYDLQSLDIGTGHVEETHSLYWLRRE